MRITVNGKAEEVPADISLAEFLARRGMAGCGGVAVAVDGRVVPAERWPEHRLAEGDRVLVVRAAQGG